MREVAGYCLFLSTGPASVEVASHGHSLATQREAKMAAASDIFIDGA